MLASRDGLRYTLGSNLAHSHVSLSATELKRLRGLLQKKNRSAEARFLVEGTRSVREAVDSGARLLDVYITDAAAAGPHWTSIAERIGRSGARVRRISEKDLHVITDTVTSQGIVAVVAGSALAPEELLEKHGHQGVIVVLDGVSDPGNLGSIVRTCDWFGVAGLLIGKNSVELHNPKVVRSTMGSIFHLPIVHDVDLLPALTRAKALGFTVYVTDVSGELSAERIRVPRKALLVFGNEAWGVSDQVKRLADARLAIRRYGHAESLNVGVACGVILSMLHRVSEE